MDLKLRSKRQLAAQCEKTWLHRVVSYLDAPVLRRYCIQCSKGSVLAAMEWKQRLDTAIRAERPCIEQCHIAEASVNAAQRGLQEVIAAKDACKGRIEQWAGQFAARNGGRQPVRYYVITTLPPHKKKTLHQHFETYLTVIHCIYCNVFLRVYCIHSN